jgi:DNA repair protein RadC
MNTRIPPDPDLIQRTWPRTETPTARLFALGPQALSDAEILAVLLRRGNKVKSALELAQEALAGAGSLSALLGRLGTLEVEAQARVSAAHELARRALREELSSRDALSSPRAVRDYLRTALAGKEHEVFVVVMLDAQHRVIACEELFRGTLTQTSV